MRTVPFSTVMNGIIARMGMDPTQVPQGNTLAAFTEYVNSAVRIAWEMYPWPEMLAYESRQFYPSWGMGTAYGAADVVLGGDLQYYSAVMANTGRNPVLDTAHTYWQPAGAVTFSNGGGILWAISLDQPGKTPIGEVIGVTLGDPRVHPATRPVAWELSAEGIVVLPRTLGPGLSGSIPYQVWVEFTIRPQQYTTASYTNGDTVPWVLAEAVKLSACACAHREDGQFDKGNAMEQLAESALDIEFDKIEMKQQQSGRFGCLSR